MNLGTRSAFLTAAVVVLALVAAAGSLLKADPGRRNLNIFTEMVVSRAAEAFSTSAAFTDGKTLQALPPGVVARGVPRFAYGDGPEEAARAGRELANPLPADAATLTRGAELFRVYCLPCHDARGGGQGPVVLRGMTPPPSLHGTRATGAADGELFHVLTRGQGTNMASYVAQLSPTERWQVIHHIRALQKEGP